MFTLQDHSIIDGISVYKARMNMGTALQIINKLFPNNDIDVVIPPDTREFHLERPSS